MLRILKLRGIITLLSLAIVLSASVPNGRAIQDVVGVSTIPAGSGVQLGATIDVNPVNNSEIAMSGNFGGEGSCVPHCSIYFPDWYSRDAGVSWSQGSILGSQWSNYFIDPAGIFDSSGNYYIGNLINTNGSFGMSLLKSMDGGASFSRLPWTWTQFGSYRLPDGTYGHVCRAADLPTGLPFPYDLPRIFADKSSGSLYRGNLYFTSHLWLEKVSSGCTPGWFGFESSSDGGQTWTNLQAFDLTYQNTYSASWPIGVSYNGTIYFSGEFGSSCGTAGNGIALFKSTNGGKSFSAKCVYAPSPPYTMTQPIPQGGGAALAASPADGNFLDMVFTGCPAGSKWGACIINPPNALFNNNTHVYSIASYDAGKTWSSPVRIDDVLPVDYTQDPGTRITVGVAPNNRVDVAWFDFRNSNGNNTLGDIYFSHSDNQGVTFSPDTRLTSSTNFICNSGWNYPPAICTAGNEFLGLFSMSNMSYVAFDTHDGPDGFHSNLYEYFSQVSFSQVSVGGALLPTEPVILVLPYSLAVGAATLATFVYYNHWKRRAERGLTFSTTGVDRETATALLKIVHNKPDSQIREGGPKRRVEQA